MKCRKTKTDENFIRFFLASLRCCIGTLDIVFFLQVVAEKKCSTTEYEHEPVWYTRVEELWEQSSDHENHHPKDHCQH